MPHLIGLMYGNAEPSNISGELATSSGFGV